MCTVKYVAPKAEVVELELSSVILASTCILDISSLLPDETGGEDDGKLPDFYGNN